MRLWSKDILHANFCVKLPLLNLALLACGISSLQRQIKEKAHCVSQISHVFSYKIRFTLLCVSVSSKKHIQKLHCCSLFLLSFLKYWDLFLLYEEFDDRYQEKPLSVTEKTSVTIFIDKFTCVAAYDSMTQDLAAKIHQKWPLLD